MTKVLHVEVIWRTANVGVGDGNRSIDVEKGLKCKKMLTRKSTVCCRVETIIVYISARLQLIFLLDALTMLLTQTTTHWVTNPFDRHSLFANALIVRDFFVRERTMVYMKKH